MVFFCRLTAAGRDFDILIQRTASAQGILVKVSVPGARTRRRIVILLHQDFIFACIAGKVGGCPQGPHTALGLQRADLYHQISPGGINAAGASFGEDPAPGHGYILLHINAIASCRNGEVTLHRQAARGHLDAHINGIILQDCAARYRQINPFGGDKRPHGAAAHAGDIFKGQGVGGRIKGGFCILPGDAGNVIQVGGVHLRVAYPEGIACHKRRADGAKHRRQVHVLQHSEVVGVLPADDGVAGVIDPAQESPVLRPGRAGREGDLASLRVCARTAHLDMAGKGQRGEAGLNGAGGRPLLKHRRQIPVFGDGEAIGVIAADLYAASAPADKAVALVRGGGEGCALAPRKVTAAAHLAALPGGDADADGIAVLWRVDTLGHDDSVGPVNAIISSGDDILTGQQSYRQCGDAIVV